MKIKFFVFTLVVVPFLVFAAKLEFIKEATDTKVEQIRKEFKKHSDTYQHDQLQGYFRMVKFSDKNKEEKIENTIKQIIYASFPGYSAPDTVTVEALENTKKSIERAIWHACDDLPVTHDSKENVVFEFLEFVQSRIVEKTQYRILIGSEGNDFGGGNFMAIVDQKNDEILILGSSYSE